MKRQHKIATVRRLVALTMLSTLLFSSTAVYADTADNDVAASEVVVETGNTSNDTNSSTNLNDTVSGNDSTDDSNITTTDINTTEGDTSVEEEISEETNSSSMLGESKSIISSLTNPFGIFTPSCKHKNLDSNDTKVVSTDDTHHATALRCENCKEYVVPTDATVSECIFDQEVNSKRIREENNTCYHDTTYKCNECGNTTIKHEEFEMTQPHAGLYECPKCHTQNDKRSHDVVIEEVTTSPVADEANVTDKYTAFDKNITITVKASCQVMNDKSMDQIKDKLTAQIFYTTYENSSKGNGTMYASMDMKSFEDGVATFEFETSKINTANEPIMIAKVKVTSTYDPSTLFNSGAKSAEKELKYYIDDADPAAQVKKLTQKVTIGSDGDKFDLSKYYSKKKHDDKNLFVTYEGVTTKAITNPELWLVSENGNEKKIEAVEAKCDDNTLVIKVPFTNFEIELALPGYKNLYKYELNSLDTDERDYTYEFRFKIGGKEYKQPAFTTHIDNVAPTVAFTYNPDDLGHGKYFNKNVTVTATLTDTYPNVDNHSVALSGTNFKFNKPANGEKVVTSQITTSKDGVYIVSGKITDLAGNECVVDGQSDIKEFIVDTKQPEVTVTYDVARSEAKHDKYFNVDRTATIVITDENIDSNEANMNKVTVEAKDGTPTVNAMTGDNGKYTGTINFTNDGIYRLSAFKFEDKAGNPCKISESTVEDYDSEFVIDKTAPVVDVKFDNNSALNGNYYKDARTAEIIFTEKNFTKDQVTITKNSADLSTIPGLSGYSQSDLKNITKISFNQDGRYGFTVACEDMAGNTSNSFVTGDFVIDMTAPELEITGVENMSANNGIVTPVISSKDANINDYSTEITLTGSNNGTINPSMTKTNGTELFTYKLEDLEHVKGNDDLYTLSVKLTDFAGNAVEKKVQYSINRFGSIFVLSDATKAMVDGYYVTTPQDVVITEINVDALTKKEVSVAYDGSVKELREGSAYTTSDLTNSNGWHSISYNVGKANFNKDGIYSVTVFTEDRASNRQSNQSKDAEIEFLLDKTAPSVIVSGIEDGGVYEEESHDFSINAADTIGVTSMTVYLNDEKLAEYNAAQLTENGGTAVLTVPSKDDYQKITVKCSDVAGNVTNLAYNNILVSVKAEELLLEDELTPTSKLTTNTDEIIGSVKNASNAIIILLIIAALAAAGGAGAYAYNKKRK